MNTPTEAEVRQMRDTVFGHATSDKNWDACKEGWMKPEGIDWLRLQLAAKEPKSITPERKP